MTKHRFREALKRSVPMVLDGGLATQLEAQGCDIGNELWSASLLQSNPDAIVVATRAYLDAGAECVATATYQASREGFATRGMTAEQADELMLRSVDLAAKARAEFMQANADIVFEPLIAASIGPYGAMLHDGSEYIGNIETVPSRLEAEVLVDLLGECQTPAWISFSCRDGAHVVDGSPLDEVAALYAAHATVVAVGVNCTPPQYVPELIKRLKLAAPQKVALAYPNSGETYNVDDNSWSGTVTPGDCATAAKSWVAAGAGIVGGCCRMGPEHIRAIREALR